MDIFSWQLNSPLWVLENNEYFRYRGSDAGFCETGEKDGGAEAYDLLLGEAEDEAAATAAGDEHDEAEGKDGTLVHKTSEQDDGKVG